MTRRILALLLGALTATLAPAASAQDQPAPFAREIGAFEKADAQAMPPRQGVLFLGSSSIRMWKTLARDFRGIPAINRGFGGSQIADSIRYAERIVIPYAPRTIVFYAGDNDLAAGKSPQQVLADFQAFAAKVHAALPATRILFVSIKPSIARWEMIERIREANALVEAYAATSDRLDFVDIASAMLGPDGRPRPELFRADGLHMTPAGYAIWRDAVAAALRREPI